MRIMYWASFPSRTTHASFVEEMGPCDEDLAAVPVLFMRQDSQSSLTLVRPQEGVVIHVLWGAS